MNTFRLTVYKPTSWSFLTQADHHDEYYMESDEPLDVFAKRIAKTGFSHTSKFLKITKWIMPGAILEITQTK